MNHPDDYRDFDSDEEWIQTQMLYEIAYEQQRTAEALHRIAEVLEDE